MRKDYIEELIVILENVRANIQEQKIKTKFDLTEWAKVNECGTTCCAIGHATLDPAFQKRGLRLVAYSSFRAKDHIVKDVEDMDKVYGIAKKKNAPAFFYIKYRDHENFEAVNSFFNFEKYGTASILFSVCRYPENNKSLRNVIARLKYLLKHGEAQLHSKHPW